MSANTISDLRKHLFDAIQGVRDGTMDIDKAKTVADLSKVVVDSARVEVDFMKVRGDTGNGTGFIPEEKQITGRPKCYDEHLWTPAHFENARLKCEQGHDIASEDIPFLIRDVPYASPTDIVEPR